VKEETNMIVVDSGAVKEKKNFNYISKMTLLISLLLIIFSIISISLFISNLLKTHLNKVKMNLGTFKAFGLSNQESINIYLQIMLRFVFTGLIFSLVISFVLGNVIDKIFSAWLSIEDQSAYFRLFDLNTYILITIIVVVSAIVSYLNIKKILSKTPGDLIYNR
jgi:ABC-type antimicrobial peptide transport system permease subunit